MLLAPISHNTFNSVANRELNPARSVLPASKGQVFQMGDRQQEAEWIAQAKFCLKMADEITDSARKVVWLELARRWMTLTSRTAPETESGRFDAAIQDKGTGQESSPSRN